MPSLLLGHSSCASWIPPQLLVCVLCGSSSFTCGVWRHDLNYHLSQQEMFCWAECWPIGASIRMKKPSVNTNGKPASPGKAFSLAYTSSYLWSNFIMPTLFIFGNYIFCDTTTKHAEPPTYIYKLTKKDAAVETKCVYLSKRLQHRDSNPQCWYMRNIDIGRWEYRLIPTTIPSDCKGCFCSPLFVGCNLIKCMPQISVMIYRPQKTENTDLTKND